MTDERRDGTEADGERASQTDGRDATSEAESRVSRDEGRGSRDVVVPMPLYKTVTVFSTLLAVLGVVGGFVLLDAAVMDGGVIRVVVNAALGLVDLRVSPSIWAALQPVFAVLGLATIALGAVVYVLGSRFRAEGMGTDEDASDGEAETGDGGTESSDGDAGGVESSVSDEGGVASSVADESGETEPPRADDSA